MVCLSQSVFRVSLVYFYCQCIFNVSIMLGRNKKNFLDLNTICFACLSLFPITMPGFLPWILFVAILVSSFLKDFFFIFISKTSYAKRLHITVFALVLLLQKSTVFLCLPWLLENMFYLAHYLCMFRLSQRQQFVPPVSVYL